METNQIYHGNCVEKLKEIESNKVDLIYFDPPFFTQRNTVLPLKINLKPTNLMINLTLLKSI